MARGLPDRLRAALDALPPGAAVWVGFSGGLDSTVLLHALAALDAARARGLHALHVDHGLHPDSPLWAAHCRRVADDLGVPLRSVRVAVERDGGHGPEAAARRARRAAMHEALATGDVLALAHHADDQAETVLLKLLRGAGPEGLGAMRKLRRVGGHWLWRPLLDLPRAVLRDYANAHGLDWIEDPSNADVALDRNRLRAEIVPRLRARWPRFEDSLAQSARWARAAADFIDAEATRALARVRALDPATLRWRAWLDLPEALRDPVLRRWLRDIGRPEPTSAQSAELARQLACADADRLPCLRWPGCELRRYRDLVHAMAPLREPPPDWTRTWLGEPLSLPVGLGTLRLVDETDRDAPLDAQAALHVHFRRGGEWLRLPGQTHRRELRDLFQQAGIPPWQRARLPMISTADGELLAVADLWLTDAGRRWFGAHGRRLEWRHDAD